SVQDPSLIPAKLYTNTLLLPALSSVTQMLTPSVTMPEGDWLPESRAKLDVYLWLPVSQAAPPAKRYTVRLPLSTIQMSAPSVAISWGCVTTLFDHLLITVPSGL